jgi:transcription elongation factor Elf1
MESIKCDFCYGDGHQRSFICPYCNNQYFGSTSINQTALIPQLQRRCSGCGFQWMDYEDFRYFEVTNEYCITCGGSGKPLVFMGYK